jgi:hypothetical protein
LGVQILKFFDADPGWEKFGSGINIPDPQHWFQGKISANHSDLNPALWMDIIK